VPTIIIFTKGIASPPVSIILPDILPDCENAAVEKIRNEKMERMNRINILIYSSAHYKGVYVNKC
jgi:hypothetical protein